MATTEKEKISTALLVYVKEDHPHPDMKIFSATNGFKPKLVAEAIKENKTLANPQKDLLLGSFIKKDMKPEIPVIVPKLSNKEWFSIRRSELRKLFFSFEGSTESFLEAHPEIPELQLRNVLTREEFRSRCDKKPRRKRSSEELQELAQVFLKLDKSVEDFCQEQKVSEITLKKYIPEDVWNERKSRTKRRIDWDEEIRLMIASGKSLEEWATERDLKVAKFREKCGKDICCRYDNNGRYAERFNAELPLAINAKMLGMSEVGLSKWVERKLSKLAPEKYKRFKMDAKDIEIERLLKENEDLKKRLRNLEGVLANKNSYIEQMRTSQAQKAAKVSAAKKTLEEVLKAL